MKRISTFLAFLSLIAVIPLFFEIWRKIWKRKKTLTLLIFTNIFSLLTGYTFWYILIGFRPQWQTEMRTIVFWTSILTIWYSSKYIGRRFNLISKIPVFLEKYLSLIVDKVFYFVHIRKQSDEYKKEFKKLQSQYEKENTLSDKVFEFFLKVVFVCALIIFSSNLADTFAPKINLKLDQIAEDYKNEDNQQNKVTVTTPIPSNSNTTSK